MNASDFKIGDLFKTETGVWQVTDVGSRVIVAMNTSEYEDKSWYNGPPYAVAEFVFDEEDLHDIEFNVREE